MVTKLRQQVPSGLKQAMCHCVQNPGRVVASDITVGSVGWVIFRLSSPDQRQGPVTCTCSNHEQSGSGEASEDLKQPLPVRLADLLLDMPLVLGGEALEFGQ